MKGVSALIFCALVAGCASTGARTDITPVDRVQAQRIVDLQNRIVRLEDELNRQRLRLASSEEQLRSMENRRSNFYRSLQAAQEGPPPAADTALAAAAAPVNQSVTVSEKQQIATERRPKPAQEDAADAQAQKQPGPETMSETETTVSSPAGDSDKPATLDAADPAEPDTPAASYAEVRPDNEIAPWLESLNDSVATTEPDQPVQPAPNGSSSALAATQTGSAPDSTQASPTGTPGKPANPNSPARGLHYDVRIVVERADQLQDILKRIARNNIKPYFVIDQPHSKRVYFGSYLDPDSAGLRKKQIEKLLDWPTSVSTRAVAVKKSLNKSFFSVSRFRAGPQRREAPASSC